MASYPTTLERDYRRALRRRVAAVERVLLDQFSEWLVFAAPEIDARVRTDSSASDADQARRIIRRVRTAYDAANPYEKDDALAQRTFERAKGYTGREVTRKYKGAVGVEPLITADTRGLAEGFVQENVALIRDLPAKQLTQIEEEVIQAIERGERAGALSKIIRERSGVAKKRADLIARDQMGKAVSQLNQKRQQDLGVDRYIWRTAGDERVRPEHVERNGETFSWSDPPPDGHPGEPINCRCTAEPVLTDILDGLGVDYDAGDFNQPDDPTSIRSAELVEKISALAGGGSAKQIQIFNMKREPRPGTKGKETGKDGVLRYDPDMLPEARREAAMDNWVNGPSRRASVLMKLAAQQEFESKGLVLTSYNRTFSKADIAAMREDIRSMYDATQAALKKAKIKEVVLYRGAAIKPGVSGEPGVLESWTSNKKMATQFAVRSSKRYPGTVPNVDEVTVPANEVLLYKDGPGWSDGRFGNQDEFVRIAKGKS